MPDPIAQAHDHVPPPPTPSTIRPDPDLRPIDLAAPGSRDLLDDGTREHLARAGQDALDACLRRFALEERAAFWRAICRCYNRPYNPAEVPPAAIPPREALPLDVVPPDAGIQASPGPVPAPHVIEAVRPVPDGVLPEATFR